MSITNKDNLKLSALICCGSYRLNTKESENSKPIIVVCHGFSGSKEGSGRALAMGEELAELGFCTLLFDFAGCGNSEGNWHSISLSKQTDDLGSIVNWCRKEGFKKIILNGRSFGGTTALNYAARDNHISAVCTWAAVARPLMLFEKHIDEEKYIEGSKELIAIKGEEGVLYLKPGFFQDLKKHDLLESAAALAPRNYLIIHGSEDESVPVEEAELLYNSAKEPKKLVIIEGADHRFSAHLDIVWEKFFDWLKSL